MVIVDVDPQQIAELNGVPGVQLRDGQALRAYATEDYRSGLLLQTTGSDVSDSFLVTDRACAAEVSPPR